MRASMPLRALKTAGNYISANPKFIFFWGKGRPRIPAKLGTRERPPISPVFVYPPLSNTLLRHCNYLLTYLLTYNSFRRHNGFQAQRRRHRWRLEASHSRGPSGVQRSVGVTTGWPPPTTGQRVEWDGVVGSIRHDMVVARTAINESRLHAWWLPTHHFSYSSRSFRWETPWCPWSNTL